MKNSNIIIKQGRVTLGPELSIHSCWDRLQKTLFNFSLVFFTQSNEKTKPSEELMQLSLLNPHNN